MCDIVAGQEIDDLPLQDPTAAKQPRSRQQESATKAKRLRRHEEPRQRTEAHVQGFDVDGGTLHRGGVEPPEFGESAPKERYELEEIARRKSQRVRRPLFR